MCYKGKCLGCIPVENGCLALAIISAIVTLLSLLASIVTGLLIITGIIMASNEVHRSHSMFDQYGFGERDKAVADTAVVLGGLAAGVLAVIVGSASLIAFIFSVLLCNGICKRRPGQVKAYFIYGVVITVLATLAAIISLFCDEIGAGIATLLGCAIYSLFLVLVHQTYSKLLEGAVYPDHVRLVETK